MKDPTPVDLLGIAEKAADAAAELLLAEHHALQAAGNAHRLRIQTKSSATDFVTVVDGMAQEQIIDLIRKRYPQHRFLAEEEGADELGSPDCPYIWIIDPLDGTTNFIHGKENFGTIVAVAKDEEILAGCMILPVLEHRFVAAKGEGSWVNGERIRLRKTAGMTDAILCSNIVRRAKKDPQGILHVSTPLCASLENYGCAAQEIGDTLLGWNDGVFFKGIKLWDIAAGCLMLSEAGGKFRYERIDPEDPRSGLRAVATTEPIFEEVCQFVFERDLA